MLYWGVFRADCYKRTPEEKNQLFVESFDDYSMALLTAQGLPDGSIHLTSKKPTELGNDHM